MNAGKDARFNHSSDVCGKIEAGMTCERCLRGSAEWLAGNERCQENHAPGWNAKDDDFQARSRHQRIFGLTCLDAADRAIASIRRKDREGRRARANNLSRGMRLQNRCGKLLGRDGSQGLRGERILVGCMKCIKPRALDARHVR